MRATCKPPSTGISTDSTDAGRVRGFRRCVSAYRLGRRSAAVALTAALLPAMLGEAVAAAHSLKAMWGPSIRNGVSQFPIYRDLGVSIYEDDLHWNLIAHRRPRNAT